MTQQANNERARVQEVMLPAAERKMMDEAIETLRSMSADERRLAMSFMRGMRFQRMMDTAAAPKGQSV